MADPAKGLSEGLPSRRPVATAIGVGSTRVWKA